MLGGIFPTIGAGAHAAGPGVILAYVLSGLVSVCVALCYAEFASMVPVAGSAYTYAYATLGELVAWIIGWDLILEYGLSLAPTASSLSDYFQHLLANVGIAFPTWAQTANVGGAHPQIDLFAAIVTLGITALVAIGIRESASVNGALVVVQIVAMIVFVAVVAHAIKPANLHPFTPFGYHGVLASTALVFFAYIGFDTVTVASEEAKRPERDVPIGIILTLVFGAALYVTLALCTVGVLRFDKLSDGAAMLDALGAATKNRAFYLIVAIGGIAGNATVMLTSLLGQVRIFYVMARDRMLPPTVARVHQVFRTPARMTAITGCIVAVFAAVFPLTDLLTLVNIGTLAAFAIVCIGVFVLRFTNPTAPAAVSRAVAAALLAGRGSGVPLFDQRPAGGHLGPLRHLVRPRDRRLRSVRFPEFSLAREFIGFLKPEGSFRRWDGIIRRTEDLCTAPRSRIVSNSSRSPAGAARRPSATT